MLDFNYVSLVDKLYNKMKIMLSEYSAFDPKVINNEKGKALLEGMKKIHSKLAFIVLTHNKQFLTVTGVQGSGKSTLVNRLYELEPGYLPENDSRGEQLPVLLTEKKGLTKPKCYGMTQEYIDGKYEIVKSVISKEDFYKTALEPSDQGNQIWLELCVPSHYFNNEDKSIILLPGFEKDKRHFSQQLLDHILFMSTSSIVVFSKDTFARESDAAMLRKVKDLFKDVQPIYAISFGDVNQEENEMIRQQVITDFNVDPQQVIITGDPQYYKEPWMEQLIQSINQFGYVTEEINEKKMEILKNITDDISDLMLELIEQLKRYEEGLLAIDLSQDSAERKLIRDFQKIYEKFLSDLKNEIIQSLSHRKCKATDSFNDYVSENINFLNNVKAFFVSSDFEESVKFEKKLEEVWRESGSTSPNEEMVDVLTNCIEDLEKSVLQSAERKKILQSSKRPLSEAKAENNNLPVQADEIGDTLSIPVQESLETINQFFAADPSAALVTLDKPELQTLVLIGSMLGRQSFVSSELIAAAARVSQDKEQLLNEANREKLEQQLEKSNNELANMKNKLDLTSQKTRMILTAIPVVLGVDGAIDGKFDLLNSATAALATVGISISPGALLSIIGISLAAVKAVDIIHKQALQNNERKIKMAYAGRKIIEELPELQANAFCQMLRNIFEKMEDRIREQHEWKKSDLGYNQDLMRLQYLSNSILKTNKQLIKEVSEHDYQFAF